MLNKSSQVFWSAPVPLLQSGRELDVEDLRRPAILRFKGDTFMQDYLNLLQVEPAAMTQLLAENESWIEPMSAPAALTTRKEVPALAMAARAKSRPLLPAVVRKAPAAAAPPVLKLFQPIHHHFYLITGSLLCPPYGLRDHTMCQGCENVTFVMRRLMKSGTGNTGDTYDEYAFVENANGKGWRKIGPYDPETSESSPGEDKLALFPGYFEGEPGRRRLWNGLIPAGRKEEYATAPELIDSTTSGSANAAQSAPIGTSRTPFKILFRIQVTEPLKALLDNAKNASHPSTPDFDVPTSPAMVTLRKSATGLVQKDLQTNSWYVLLDFQKFLEKYLPRVWNHMAGLPAAAGVALNAAEQKLIDTLSSIVLDRGNLFADGDFWNRGYHANLLEALVGIAPSAAALEDNTGSLGKPKEGDNWDFKRFPLVSPYASTANPPPCKSSLRINGAELGSVELPLNEETSPPPDASIDHLVALVERAIPEDHNYKRPVLPDAAHVPLSPREPLFIIRFVFESDKCKPFLDDHLSRASRPFTLAGFFDSDAPMRPVRISMPFNPSIAGIRKFHKNATFVISNTMCGFKKSAAGLSFLDLVLYVLPWPFHRDLPSGSGAECKTSSGEAFGLLCTLSIPIITLCAFIILIIMVTLLDIIFKWFPYFIFCFPIPGLKKKE